MTDRRWIARVRSRLAVAAASSVGIAGYALAGAAPAVPLHAAPASVVASDHYAAATVDDGNGNFDVVAMGPDHSLYLYWQTNGTWYGPLQIAAAGSVFSGPGIDSEADYNFDASIPGGNLDVAVEGPNHTLWFFWQDEPTNTWYGPYQIGGPGSTYSKPSVSVDQAGHVNVVAQGPNGTLWFYWATGGHWYGPFQFAGPGSASSAPAMHDESNYDSGGPTNCSTGNTCLGVAVTGPSGQSILYWNADGTWLAPVVSGTGQEFSSPAITTSSQSLNACSGPKGRQSPHQGCGEPYWLAGYEGPGNSLVYQFVNLGFSNGNGGTNSFCIAAPADTTFTAPSDIGFDQADTFDTTGNFLAYNVMATGPASSLYAYWIDEQGPNPPNSCGGAFYGPLQLSGAGTTFSVSSEDAIVDSVGNQVVNAVIEGPSHTLWLFWSTAGSWHGPLQIGGPGTTFDSSS